MVSLRQVHLLALACACVDAAPQAPYWVPAVTPAITGFNPFWQPRPNKDTPPPFVAPEPTATDAVAPAPAPVPAPLPVPAPTLGPQPVTEYPTQEETSETPSPSPTPSNTTESSPPAPTSPKPTPAPATKTPAPTPKATRYVPPPIPATGTASLAKVENPVCGDEVVQTIFAIYSKNRYLFDLCAEKSKYQIFPFSGKLPTPAQIYALASTNACTVLFTACVVSKLPECDNSGLNLRAVTESLLKVSMDVQNGRESPDTQRFHDMHYWWRDSNLAKAAGVPYGNDSALYAEFARDVPAALSKYSVQVQPDLTIVYNGTDITKNGPNSYFFNTTSGSMADIIADVHPNDAVVDDGGSGGNAVAPTTDVNTMSGSPSLVGSVLTLSSVLLGALVLA